MQTALLTIPTLVLGLAVHHDARSETTRLTRVEGSPLPPPTSPWRTAAAACGWLLTGIAVWLWPLLAAPGGRRIALLFTARRPGGLSGRPGNGSIGRRAPQASEGLTVPLKPDNTGGGKEPWFGVRWKELR